ncbi:unnamed protein product [Cunninghamella blakesleeana]
MELLPSLPNELLLHIITYLPNNELSVFLYVCRYTYQLVCGKVYKKVSFPDTIHSLSTIISFCQKYGSSLTMVKLPLGKRYSDTFFMLLFQLCPHINYLQSSITPKQLKRLLPRQHFPYTCFKITHIPSPYDDSYSWDHELMDIIQDHYDITSFKCCSSLLLFPNHPIEESTLTQITYYYHHVGALRNAILPTFGPDLLSLTLNVYDILTPSIAQLIAKKCPRLRYLHAPRIKAEGLWMLLHKCNTLVTIVVGGDADSINNNSHHHLNQQPIDFLEENDHPQNNHLDHDDEDDMDETELSAIQWMNETNERAIATVTSHKRVWGIHQQSINHSRITWHLNILPKI